MEVICEIGICSREEDARTKELLEDSEPDVEQKERDKARCYTGVIKISLWERRHYAV